MTPARRGLAAAALCLSGLAACDDTDSVADPVDDATADAAADAAADAERAPDPAERARALVDRVDMTRYADDLERLSRGPRETGVDPHWRVAADRCAEVLLDAGLEVVRQPLFDGGENIIGVLPGLGRPDERIVLGAHYDSEVGCAGADDNASGTAGVLEAARALAGARFERTVVFACFDAEEQELRGSADYAARARDRGDDIRGVFVLEMIAYADDTPGSQGMPTGLELAFPAVDAAFEARERRGDFIFYAADDDPEMVGHLEAWAAAAELPVVGLQLDPVLRASALTLQLRRSDHDPFWQAGYPGIMLTDTAEYRNGRYHCARGEDDIGELDVDFAVRTTRAVVGAVAAAAGPVDGPPAAGRVVDPEPVAAPAPLLCDVTAGTCDDGQRCALVLGEPRRLECRAAAEAPLGLDAPCERADDGTDLCAAGLFCTRTGLGLGGQRRCRPLCRTAADCAEGEACPDIGAPVSNCVSGCDPLDDACPEGTTCRHFDENGGLRARLSCGLAEDAGEGELCDRALCGRGLVCSTAHSGDRLPRCVAWCRPSAPECVDGRTCVPFRRAGLPDDLGLCVADEALLP